MPGMRRREFVSLFGGAAAWPVAARAQQAMPVVGFLRSTPAFGFAYIVDAFRQGLNDEGFVEGKSVAVEYRWADNQLDRVPGLAADLIRKQVAAIVAPALRPRRQAKSHPRQHQSYSSSVPIRSEPAWSQALTGRVVILRASSSPALRWRPSCSGYCISWFPTLPSSSRCATRTFQNSRQSRETWRRQAMPSGGKS